MIRVVADANVLVSAVLARSPNSAPVIVLDAAIDGRMELVTSPMLLAELADVLRRPRLRPYLSLDEAEYFIAGRSTRTRRQPAAACRSAPRYIGSRINVLVVHADIGAARRVGVARPRRVSVVPRAQW